ncbi:hypothetical protein FRC12_014018 [Ceratobasidium sp. 428]|nr:hypothetical protein FRC12_014018 [Ceratobasidium sp. 428]
MRELERLMRHGSADDYARAIRRIPVILQFMADLVTQDTRSAIWIHFMTYDENREPHDCSTGSNEFLSLAAETDRVVSRDALREVLRSSSLQEHELLNSRFPKLPLWDIRNLFKPFTDDILKECEGLIHMVPNLPLAAGMANEYQTRGPPGGPLGMFKSPAFVRTFTNLPTTPLTPETFPEWLAEPLTDQFYYTEADNHDTWGPLPLSKLYRVNHWLDPDTNLVCGGPNSIPLAVGIILKCGRYENQYKGMKHDYSNSHPSMVQSYFRNAATNIQTWIGESLRQISDSADEREISKVTMPVFGQVLSLEDAITAGPLAYASSAAILPEDDDSDFVIQEPEVPEPEIPESGAAIDPVAPLVSAAGTVKSLHQSAVSGRAHSPRDLLQVQAESTPHVT